jgi:hypothetical protein
MKIRQSSKRIVSLVFSISLMLVAGLLPLLGGDHLFRATLNPGDRENFSGQIPGAGSDNFVPPEDGNFQPGQGMPPAQSNQRPGEGQPYSGGSGSFPAGEQGSSTQMKILLLLRYAACGAILLSGIITGIGIVLRKKWARVYAILTAAVALMYTISSMIHQMGGGINLTLNILSIVLALGLVLFLFHPEKQVKSQPESIADD